MILPRFSSFWSICRPIACDKYCQIIFIKRIKVNSVKLVFLELFCHLWSKS